jgi:hypothetical protein
MLDFQAMSAVPGHPEAGGQSGYCQAGPKVQTKSPGDFLLKYHNLNDDKPGYDESCYHRREDALFSACEEQHCGDE